MRNVQKDARKKKHWRIRKKVAGTQAMPRMSVYRSLRHLHVQLVDDINGNSLVACSTLSKSFREIVPEYRHTKKSAKELGKLIAALAQKKDIQQVVFDRSGYIYHGKVRALAEGAREGGLRF